MSVTLSDALLAALAPHTQRTLKPPTALLPAETPLAVLGMLSKLLEEVSSERAGPPFGSALFAFCLSSKRKR